MKPTDKSQIRKDVVKYLHNKYHQDFDVLSSEWVCHEGNGCPDGHIVICFPKDNPELKFRLDIVYDGKDFEVQRNEYFNELIDYQAEKELDKLLSGKISLFEKDVSVSADERQLSKYDPYTINYEKVLQDYPGDVALSIQLYILENNSSRKEDYLNITKDIIRRFFPLPIEELIFNIYYYNGDKYSKMTRKEIRDIFEKDYTTQKDATNCEKEWAMFFEKSKIANIDSLLNNIESSIHEYNYKK